MALRIASGLLVLGVFLAFLFLHPKTPLPPQWNPAAILSVTHPVTPLTTWKLRRTVANPVACLAALNGAAEGTFMPPLEVSEECHVRNRVRLLSVGRSAIEPIETACATALRLAFWERHGLQPAARDILGTEVTEIRQIGSFNCRPIRTPSGVSQRMSTHATAEAIDITGFRLADGREVSLLRDWSGTDAEAMFLHAARDSACRWFATTLGPDFNRFHADHFHLQARGWGTCR